MAAETPMITREQLARRDRLDGYFRDELTRTRHFSPRPEYELRLQIAAKLNRRGWCDEAEDLASDAATEQPVWLAYEKARAAAELDYEETLGRWDEMSMGPAPVQPTHNAARMAQAIIRAIR